MMVEEARVRDNKKKRGEERSEMSENGSNREAREFLLQEVQGEAYVPEPWTRADCFHSTNITVPLNLNNHNDGA